MLLYKHIFYLCVCEIAGGALIHLIQHSMGTVESQNKWQERDAEWTQNA